MIVYGDAALRVAPRPALLALAAALAAQGASADLFVDAAALAQGLIDAEFRARGDVDARSDTADALMAALTRLAASMLAGTRTDHDAWRAMARRAPETAVSVKLAESFAFYALDPRAYAEVAQAAGLGADTRVIGLRSIGVALAAVVAAAAGATPPITVRPTGHPFARRLSLEPGFLAEVAREAGPVAVVDEGPGLSGSSFLAVADALAEAGVTRDRLVLLPSHGGGPGSQASDAARAIFREGRAFAATLPTAAQIAAGFEDMLGPALEPPEELGGGAWRTRLYTDAGRWPAVATPWERRKPLVHTAKGLFLLKWAGFGHDAQGKLARAHALARAGLSPPVSALRDGWLVQPWIEARPLAADDPAPVAEIAASLGLRARAFPAAEDEGASPAALVEMVRVNVGEAVGEQQGLRAEALVARGLAGPSPARVMIDGRLHLHEWLRTPEGRILKTDALDHARGHDLIGAQEIGWDVAGAAVEWRLSDAQATELAQVAEAPPARLPALTVAYLAFQLGAAAMAADMVDAEERVRLLRERGRYERALRLALA